MPCAAGHTIAEIVAKTGIPCTSLYWHLPPHPPDPVTAGAPPADGPQGALTAVALSELDRQRAAAVRRWQVLRPVVEDGVPLAVAARAAEVPVRTVQRWLARYRSGGLARTGRADLGQRRVRGELVRLVEGLALRRPAPSAATIARQIAEIAGAFRRVELAGLDVSDVRPHGSDGLHVMVRAAKNDPRPGRIGAPGPRNPGSISEPATPSAGHSRSLLSDPL